MALRERTAGELLDASFKLAGRHFKALALCVLVVAAPFAVLDTLVTAATSDGAFDYAAVRIEGTGSDAAVLGNLLVLALGFVTTAVATGACLRIVGADVLGGPPAGAGDSLRAAVGRVGGLIGVSLLYGLCVVCGIVALVLPGVWIAVAAALATPALFFERLGPAAALTRSVRLVGGMWWRTFGVLLVLFLVVGVLQLLAGALLTGAVLSESSNEALNGTLETLVTIVAQVITLPLTAAATTLLYVDLRVRKEGFGGDAGRSAEAPAPPPPLWSGPQPPAGGFSPPQPPPGG